MANARPKNSRDWVQRHLNDPFVKKAQEEGYRSRAVYKLQEIDSREGFLKPGAVVVDLGSAPGGWSQLAIKKVGAIVWATLWKQRQSSISHIVNL